jgi:hypothetical protein
MNIEEFFNLKSVFSYKYNRMVRFSAKRQIQRQGFASFIDDDGNVVWFFKKPISKINIATTPQPNKEVQIKEPE